MIRCIFLVVLCFFLLAYYYTPILLIVPPTKARKSPLGIPWQGTPVTLSKRLYDTAKIPFEEHTIDPPWLGMQLNSDCIIPLFYQLNTTEQPLINRGEAHITILSPPEFKTLSTYSNITIDELNDLARKYDIQSSGFTVECLGKVYQEDNVVFQLIVSSPALISLRRHIFQLYYSRHGNPSLFDPEAYWPHITIGFTHHDLFIEQGIFKGLNACYRPVIMK